MRTRNKTIPFRVTEKELSLIDRKAAKAKLSRTDFLVASALGKQITLIEDLKPVLTELHRIGNNLNQLTRTVHMGQIQTIDLSGMRKEVALLWQSLNSLPRAVR